MSRPGAAVGSGPQGSPGRERMSFSGRRVGKGVCCRPGVLYVHCCFLSACTGITQQNGRGIPDACPKCFGATWWGTCNFSCGGSAEKALLIERAGKR